MRNTGARFLLPLTLAATVAGAGAPLGTAAAQGAHGTRAEHAAFAPAALDSVSGLPPSAATARQALERSTRHGEWVMIPTGPGPADSVRAWVVYPQRSTRAPVIMVVHEIFGMSTWIRAVTDRLAAEGYIAIAPDLLTGKYPQRSAADTIAADAAVALVQTLHSADIDRQLDAVARYAVHLPAAQRKLGIIGFCWGGGTAFRYASHAPSLAAAVIYYGPAPSAAALSRVRAPVLGLYGGDDMRVDATIPRADSALRAAGVRFEHVVFPGAGHGFLRAQDAQGGANRAAAAGAWPRTVAWFRHYLGR